MPPSTSYCDRILRTAMKLRAKGWTFRRIGESLSPPIRQNTLIEMFRRRGLSVTLPERECALFECAVVFVPHSMRKKFCSRKHAKRGCERERLGKTPAYLPCRLPECDVTVLTVDRVGRTGRRYCSKKHNARHLGRLASGFYDKLVNRTRCAGCGWWGPGIEQHHIRPKSKGGSNHRQNLAWVCGNCHIMIHAGLAYFDHRRKFIDLREDMRSRELARRKLWGRVDDVRPTTKKAHA